MPPKKRKADDQQAEEVDPARLTRSATKRATASSGPPSVAELPEKKTNKAKGKPKKQKEPKKGVEEAALAVTEKGEAKASGDSSANVLDASRKTIVVEHCKQCNSFKTRANLVKEGLEKRASGITVILNPEKPRRGCFEIREEGGKKFISLLDMKRPFKPMKDLDMDQVISDIIDEISSTS